MTIFPKIKRDTCCTINGNFYFARNNKWFKGELYLPCATGTYGEPLEVTAERWLDEIEQGERALRHAISDSGGCSKNDMSAYIQKWFSDGVL
ncbi:TPA: hypothetical protein N3288_000216 [Klebsiella aerogenes]|nr:hypothetical protein [Klebsiella aerogenes]